MEAENIQETQILLSQEYAPLRIFCTENFVLMWGSEKGFRSGLGI